jgi:hypothetical protein
VGIYQGSKFSENSLKSDDLVTQQIQHPNCYEDFSPFKNSFFEGHDYVVLAESEILTQNRGIFGLKLNF